MESNIEQLERRYQALLNDYQSGRLDEAAFVAEVDQLQMQDEWGRYWMIGTQSGDWHYYDGQSWHQADPRNADKLPVMDDQGRYWQKGTKSGEWYFFEAETNEWVKPDQDGPAAPAAMPTASYAPPQSYTAQQNYNQPYTPAPAQASGGPDAGQFGTELFQDDEGRYWAVGAKSGQWYFYDNNGWHPSEEFRGGGSPQPQPYQQYSAPQQPAQPYPSQTSQFAAQQPAQGYPPQPQQPYPPASASQPQQPVGQMYAAPTGPSQPATDSSQMPSPPPPGAAGQPGSWFYFDGEQWLQYSNGEPAADTPPDPGLILEQDSEQAKEKAVPKAAAIPIVAEFIEEDDGPAEVVDVEVITVFEAEPEPVPTPAPQPQSEPIAPVSPAPQSFTESPSPTSTSSLSAEQIVPRRTRISPTEDVKPDKSPAAAAAVAAAAVASQSPRTQTDPNRPVTPRRRASAPHEPTIIIPTGSTTAPAPRASRPSSPTVPIVPAQQRRARENTLPMEPIPAPKADPSRPVTSTQHRQVTQAMPVIGAAAVGTATVGQPQATSAKQQTGTQPAAPAANTTPTQKEQSEKSGYTLGEILRAIPSTMWTFAGGIVVLIIFAIIFIGAMSLFSGGDDANGVAVVISPTPTLDAGPPDSTPTPGPTPTGAAGPVVTPTPVSEATFSSSDLDIMLEYPENWQTADNAQIAIFSPSAGKLNPDAIKETSMRVGKSATEDASISDLLAETLSQFPPDAENLNEGTISIASQTWTSTQISFDDENLAGGGIATLAVTSRDGTGYYLIAVSPADEWNSVQPVFQGMINSFRFGAETIVAKADTPESTADTTKTTPEATDEKEESAKPTSTPTTKPTATPVAAATPLVYAVKSGDTLLGIAVKFGLDPDLLASENGIDDPSGLQIGQELTIPFTAEQLAAYNGTNSGVVASTSSDDAEKTSSADAAPASDDAAAAADTSGETTADTPEEAAADTPEETTQAAPVSGRIVYPAFNPGPNMYDVWMVDLATGEQTPIAGTASQPAFNKDGTLLAYRSWDRGTRGIFFRDFVGGRGGIVTKFVEDALPTWSPDGFSFAFSSRKEGDRVPRVYIGNQQAENPFAVGFQGEYPATFPDGKLVVKGCTASGDCGLFTMGSRGGGEKKISGEPSDTAPAVSPDGSKIAIMSRDRGGNNWEIWVINADGTNPQRLTEDKSNDGLPTWSPDGQSIAFVSDRGGSWAVWGMNTDGSNQRKLFDMKGSPDGKILYDEFNSRGWLEERISWAP